MHGHIDVISDMSADVVLNGVAHALDTGACVPLDDDANVISHGDAESADALPDVALMDMTVDSILTNAEYQVAMLLRRLTLSDLVSTKPNSQTKNLP